MEPISLIADYYGEKLALFMTFLIHHVGQMIIPSIFGLVVQGFHLYYGYHLDTDALYLTRYLNSVDQRVNYLYIILLALWSTWYIESWKRKQNTIKYIWASEQRISDIQTASKR